LCYADLGDDDDDDDDSDDDDDDSDDDGSLDAILADVDTY
jgi:hypothetical protein